MEDFFNSTLNERGNDSSAIKKRKSKKADGPSRFDRLARDYVEWLGEQRRYPLFHAGRFYTYQGNRYVEAENLAMDVRDFFKVKGIGQGNNVIGNVLPIVQNIGYRSVADNGTAMPFYVGDGKFPRPERIVAFNNGLLDLDRYLAGDGTLLPHTPKWCSTICAPHDFNPQATCPRWLAFLNEVFEGDVDRIALLQEWAGYLMTTDTSQHKMMILTGVPRSGKSTISNVLGALVGEENSTAYNLHSLTDTFGLRWLVGKLVAFVGEADLTGDKNRGRILEKLKDITGGGSQPIERKNDNASPTVVLPTRFVVACNQLPHFIDPSGALASRLLILDFQVSFEGRENRGLADELLAEISGIAAWALDGLRRLKENGRFTEGAHQKELVNSFRRENSPALAFTQDCLVVNRSLNPGNLTGVELTDKLVWISRDTLIEAYGRWCNDTLLPQKSPDVFTKDLRTTLPKLKYDRRNKKYAGIYLMENSRAGSLGS